MVGLGALTQAVPHPAVKNTHVIFDYIVGTLHLQIQPAVAPKTVLMETNCIY